MSKVNFLETPWWSAKKQVQQPQKVAQRFTDDLYEQMQQFRDDENKENEIEICPACQSERWEPDTEHSNWTCYDCGFIGDNVIDQGQEWRQYQGDDFRRGGDPSRVGIPVHEYFRKSSLSTCIRGRSNQGGYPRLQRYQSMDPEERKLLYSFRLLDQNVSTNEMNTNTREKAKYLYKCISETNNKPTHRKRSVAACVYLACQNGRQSTDMDDVSKWFYMDKKKVAKGCKQSREALFQKHPECLKQLQPQTPEDEIKRIQNLLGDVDPTWIESAQELAHFAQEFGIGLKAVPTSLAVGCLWWIYQEAGAPWTIADIARVGPCSEVTVQKSWNMLINHQETIEVFRKIRPIVYQRTNTGFNQNNQTWVKWMHQNDSSLGNAQSRSSNASQ